MSSYNSVKSPAFSENEFSDLCALVQSRTGMQVDGSRVIELSRLLERRQSTPSWLMQALSAQPLDSTLWQEVVAIVAIGETYFFRNKNHYDGLQFHILPKLIETRREMGQKFLRFWSAGCSTGEEPYSLAMLLRDMLPDIEDWLITIMATDVNGISLESARRGVYTTNSFRSETRVATRERWFTPQGRFFELSPTIRRMVTFKMLNLVDDAYPSFESNTMSMDVIFCRNVTIYFEREQTRKIISRMHTALVSNGWLIVGHSEPQPGVYDAFKMETLEQAIFYRKPEMTIKVEQPVRPALPPVVPSPPPPPEPPNSAVVRRESLQDIWAQAVSAADADRGSEALILLATYAKEYPLNPHVHYLRALVLLQMNDLVQAEAALRQAIYCDPSNALAHYTLGECYERLKNPRQALHHWKQAQKLLAEQEPDASVSFSGDMTVEMLDHLVTYQMSRVAG